MNLSKGDHFWMVQIQGWGGILDLPVLRRYVVIGGGDQYLLYRQVWESTEPGIQPPDGKIKRYDLERRAYPTHREALAQGRLELMALRLKAAKDLTTATTAISWIDEQRDDESDVNQ